MRHVMGERAESGLLCLERNAGFEPRPRRVPHGADQVLKQAEVCLLAKIPVVVDTHRINYTGSYRDDSLRELDRLLSGLTRFGPRFLTTVELGEAVEQDGTYRDVWTGEAQRLTACGEPWRKPLRKWIGTHNAGLVARICGGADTTPTATAPLR